MAESTPRLLEREAELRTLRDAVVQAAGRGGSVVLLSGEAGIGKSSLVRSLAAEPGADARVLVGACDDFITRRTLGPIHDIARLVGGELQDAVGSGDVSAVLEVLLDELDHPLRPTVVVLEDVHWADEATLDVARFVGRRIGRLPAVLLLTYREDDVDVRHPLHGVLGALPPGTVRHVRPNRLSAGAVAELARHTSLDVEEVTQITGGNPFFVTEVVRGGSDIPASVADAVLARLRLLPDDARDAVELLSVLPRAADRPEVSALVPSAAAVAEAEHRGLLEFRGGLVGFRHELTRRAILDSLPTATRLHHDDTVLDYLLDHDGDAPAILHHAVQVGRGDVVAQYGPTAAHEAFVAGAHREALAHQLNVLRHADRLETDTRARILEEHAWSLYNLHHFPEALDAASRAVLLRAQPEDGTDALVRALLTRSRMEYMTSRVADAVQTLREAEEHLGRLQDPAVRVEWQTQHVSLLHLSDAHREVAPAADAAVPAAERIGRPDVVALVQMYAAASQLLLGEDADGQRRFDHALTVARDHSLLEPRARTYTNLVEHLLLTRRWDQTTAYIEEAIAFYDDHDFSAHRYNTQGQRARMALLRGDWPTAEATLDRLSAGVPDAGVIAAIVLEAAAMLAVRRGDDDAPERVARAWDAACRSESAQYLVPAACWAIELAWSSGDPDAADAYLAPALEAAGDTLWRDWLLWRMPLVGRTPDPSGARTEPERTSLQGDWQSAAHRWAALGMPYEQALELLRSGEVEATLEAVRLLDDLGAAPAARLARQQLRELGVTSVPRGPQDATRSNPAGLTARQLEVALLVADGLTNAEIAERLVVSVRTVDHHVSAVLRKLDVTNRQDATVAIRELGRPTTPGRAGPAGPGPARRAGRPTDRR